MLPSGNVRQTGHMKTFLTFFSMRLLPTEDCLDLRPFVFDPDVAFFSPGVLSLQFEVSFLPFSGFAIWCVGDALAAGPVALVFAILVYFEKEKFEKCTLFQDSMFLPD